MYLNKNYLRLKDSYLFITIDEKVKAYKNAHPNTQILKLGIGDVTRPLAKAVIEAMHKAVDELGKEETFRGYKSDQGYEFLREAVKNYYQRKGVSLNLHEIFISDGAKSDTGNMLDIFGPKNLIMIPDPVYPVYVDTNLMSGHEIIYLLGNEENNFLPIPNIRIKADIIYLCSPNNPTGAAFDKKRLKAWVDYALENEAVILYDAAYEIFIDDDNIPSSIYQIEGASECALEFCSFSKTAGFTGVRCGYTIVPLKLKRKVYNYDRVSLNDLWLRRQTTKFNGVSYITQRGAEAVFSEEGYSQIKNIANYYKENAKIISDALTEAQIWFVGGKYSPYVWMRCPDGLSSWGYFEKLLNEAHIVGTPGAGFGSGGEGYFRLTAFGDRETVKEAAQRIKKI